MWSDLELALALSASEMETKHMFESEKEDPLYWSILDLEMKAKHRLQGDFIETCASGSTQRLKELLMKPIEDIGAGLVAAAENGRVSCIPLLLASSSFKDVIRALETACEQGHSDIITLLSPRIISRLEGRMALSRLLPRVCTQARFDIGMQFLSLGVTTPDEALAETLALLCKDWNEPAETFAVTLIQKHQAKLTYVNWPVCNHIFRQ